MSTGLRYKSKPGNPEELALCKGHPAICRKSIDLRTKEVPVASVLLFSWVAEQELADTFSTDLHSFLT
ncbi:hypothetical protein llap_15788 [Limosa lapponica baueri]|uniref:Uncharacterized protein n=1 Tax=Limosa lapponica baueri TaxID=1758121 RepID=A0A2I0TJD0_LIMLA|nr:hypothetical protein llap_15788 [Limosa lapponica baueri]